MSFNIVDLMNLSTVRIFGFLCFKKKKFGFSGTKLTASNPWRQSPAPAALAA
jgi:hypothetical protein